MSDPAFIIPIKYAPGGMRVLIENRSKMKNATKKLRVAIIGSGPAGFYSAERVFKKSPFPASIDMFDLLPTPHGLVRHGVAPDHQKIKSVSKVYDRIASNPGFRFFGFVEFGRDVTLADLKRRYHQIVFSTGAQTDKKIDIPGENLTGSHTATEFVAWYNGHPHSSDLDFDMSCGRAVVVGVGNVAVDVARMLCLGADELSKTDIADYALKKLASSNIREIYIIGRRGPAQAAFTNPELRELGNISGVHVVTNEKDMRLDPLTKEALEKKPDAAVEKKLETLRGFLPRARKDAEKTLCLRFLLSPVRIDSDGDGKVSGITFVKNRLTRKNDGSISAVATDRTERIETGLVFRSIGYRGVSLTDVPFDEKAGVIPNSSGRVLDRRGGKPLEGLYTTGWIKRGATGIIGTNKADSAETVDLMIEDFVAGGSFKPDLPENSIEKLLEKKKPDFVSYRKWSALDKRETARGGKTGRPRVKYTSIEEIMKALEKVSGDDS